MHFTRRDVSLPNVYKVPYDVEFGSSCRITVDFEKRESSEELFPDSSTLHSLAIYARVIFHGCPWFLVEDTVLGKGGSVIGGDRNRLLILLWSNPDLLGGKKPVPALETLPMINTTDVE